MDTYNDRTVSFPLGQSVLHTQVDIIHADPALNRVSHTLPHAKIHSEGTEEVLGGVNEVHRSNPSLEADVYRRAELECPATVSQQRTGVRSQEVDEYRRAEQVCTATVSQLSTGAPEVNAPGNTLLLPTSTTFSNTSSNVSSALPWFCLGFVLVLDFIQLLRIKYFPKHNQLLPLEIGRRGWGILMHLSQYKHSMSRWLISKAHHLQEFYGGHARMMGQDIILREIWAFARVWHCSAPEGYLRKTQHGCEFRLPHETLSIVVSLVKGLSCYQMKCWGTHSIHCWTTPVWPALLKGSDVNLASAGNIVVFASPDSCSG